MSTSLGALAESLKVVRKARRAGAHIRLLDWAEHRDAALEGLGWPPCSTIERFRREGAGAGQSTAPGQFTSVERAANRQAQVLQIERLVRDLPHEWQEVVAAKYIAGFSQRIVAEVLGLEQAHVWSRVADAQERIATALAAFNTLPIVPIPAAEGGVAS